MRDDPRGVPGRRGLADRLAPHGHLSASSFSRPGRWSPTTALRSAPAGRAGFGAPGPRRRRLRGAQLLLPGVVLSARRGRSGHPPALAGVALPAPSRSPDAALTPGRVEEPDARGGPPTYVRLGAACGSPPARGPARERDQDACTRRSVPYCRRPRLRPESLRDGARPAAPWRAEHLVDPGDRRRPDRVPLGGRGDGVHGLKG